MTLTPTPKKRLVWFGLGWFGWLGLVVWFGLAWLSSLQILRVDYLPQHLVPTVLGISTIQLQTSSTFPLGPLTDLSRRAWRIAGAKIFSSNTSLKFFFMIEY
jgi:hypothetical protein